MQLDVREAARMLGVDEAALQRWVRRGELTARRAHDQLLFDRVDLLEFASSHGLTARPELTQDAPEARPPSLAAAVRAGGVHAEVPGSDVASVLRAVVDRLPLPPSQDRAFLAQMLLAREAQGSTGLGHGFAVPHPREPVVLRVPAPFVAVSYLAQPVDFGAPDGLPVHTLFTLVTPSVRVHLQVLAALARALHDEGVKAALGAHAPLDALLVEIERLEGARTGAAR